MAYVKAFVVGGLLCAIAQAAMDLTKANPAIIMVSAVSAGAILSGLGLYAPLVEFAGAGATIPLPGLGIPWWYAGRCCSMACSESSPAVSKQCHRTPLNSAVWILDGCAVQPKG